MNKNRMYCWIRSFVANLPMSVSEPNPSWEDLYCFISSGKRWQSVLSSIQTFSTRMWPWENIIVNVHRYQLIPDYICLFALKLHIKYTKLINQKQTWCNKQYANIDLKSRSTGNIIFVLNILNIFKWSSKVVISTFFLF